MTNQYNADEVLQIAEEIERNGKAFYAAAAAIASETKSKELFLELAEWEGRHQQTFANIRKNEGRDDSGALLLDPEQEEVKYLKAFAEGKIFSSLNSPASLADESNHNQLTLLSFAIEREKDSVVFYTAISRSLQDSHTRDIVDKIVGEEISHIRYLTTILQNLSDSEE